MIGISHGGGGDGDGGELERAPMAAATRHTRDGVMAAAASDWRCGGGGGLGPLWLCLVSARRSLARLPGHARSKPRGAVWVGDDGPSSLMEDPSGRGRMVSSGDE